MNDLNLDTRLRNGDSVNTEQKIASAVDASPEYIAKVREAASKFEGFFIAQILRQMRESTRTMASDDSVFNSRSGREMLDMADVALADSMAGQGAFGIADVIVRQLLPTASQVPLKQSTPTVAPSD
jgi:peptidoglycan hydrolase FlgJ